MKQSLSKIKEQISKIRKEFIEDYTETEHWYRHIKTSNLVPSVTTIMSMLEKPWLIDYRIKEAVKYILDNHGQSVEYHELENVISASVTASKKKTEVAKAVGSKVHYIIETWFDKWIIDGVRPDKDLIESFDPNFIQDETTHLRYDTTETQIIASLRSAQQFIDEHPTFTPIAVEINVGDAEAGYAGKLDMLVMVDDKLEIWDWKTSNFIPPTDFYYPAQINAYAYAFEKMTGLTVDNLKVVQLSKHEDRFSMYEVNKSEALLESFKLLAKFYEETKIKRHKYYSRIYRHK